MKLKQLDLIACVSIGELFLPVALMASISLSCGIVVLLFLALLAWPCVRAFRRRSRFVGRLVLLITWAVLAAIICVGTPLLLLSPETLFDTSRTPQWDVRKVVTMLDFGLIVLVYLVAQRLFFLGIMTFLEKRRQVPSTPSP